MPDEFPPLAPVPSLYGRFTDLIHQMLAPLAGYERVAASVAVAFGFVLTGALLGWILRFASLWLMRRLGVSRILDRFFEADINHRRYEVDRIVARALSWFVFTLFIREAVKSMGFADVEKFLSDLIGYLPSLFLAVMIGFFGIRFSNTAYDVIHAGFKYYEDEQTAKVVAILGKGVVLAFTLMIMLNYAKVVDHFIINAIFVGFIFSLALAFGLAFGLGGREFARDAISRLKRTHIETKEEKKEEKN